MVTGIVFLISGGHKLLSTNTGLYALAEELGELPLPLLAATAGALVLFLCGSALVLGLFTRLVSVPLAVVMVVDILLFHPPTVHSLWRTAVMSTPCSGWPLVSR